MPVSADALPAVRVNAPSTESQVREAFATASTGFPSVLMARIFVVICAQASEIEVTPLRSMPVSATAVPPIVTLKVPSVIALMLSGRVLTAAALNAAERTKAAAAFLWERHMYSWVGFRKLLL